MQVQLSDHFSYAKLFKFTIPTIVMMLLISLYGVVDGLFVSNFVGSNALSSINIVIPLIMGVSAFGFMLGSGGGAEVAKKLGEKDNERAKKYFTLVVIAIICIGVFLSALCVIFIRPLCYLLGASDLLIEDCVTYGRIIMSGITANMLQATFQTFFIVSGKPKFGLLLSLSAGVTNIILDFLFIYVFHWGIMGAAIATVCGYVVAGVIPFVYFLLPNKSLLKFTKPTFEGKVLLRSCANGSSEMMTNMSISITTFLYNLQMMKLVGANGVAAITVIMYVNFIFISMFLGFSMGTAPIIGYNFGAQNHDELKNLFKKSMIVISIASVVMIALAESTASPLVSLFLGRNQEIMDMTVSGFRLFAISFLFCGMNIFGSSFFTALCNGKISAIISALRSLILQGGLILLLPLVIGLNGIWLAVVFSEILTLIVTIIFLIVKRKKYQYG